jgi:serine/threonine-protein kinase
MRMADALTRPGPGGDASTAERIAQARQTTPSRLARQLRGDLARITEMALRKDPDRRYLTAAHLAEDLERYLDGRPVMARAQSLAYRASRFARRHRLALAAAAIVVVTLVGYIALTVRHAREMEQAAARERQEAVRAREVADFVVGLFEAGDPNVVQDREAPIAKMIDQGLQRADKLSAQPQLQARLFNAIGRVYFNLGRYDAAATIADRALAASRQAGGDQHPDVARDYRLLGLVTGAQGKHEEAAGLFGKAIEIHAAGADTTGIEAATDTHHLGLALVQAGRLDEGERRISESLAARRTLLDPGHEDIATSLSGLAFVRGRQGSTRESVDLYREALALQIARLGEQHPDVAQGRLNLAAALTSLGAFDEAEQELHRAHGVYRAAYGERHPSVATTLSYLGRIEARRGRNAEAVRYITAALEMRRELLGPDHPSTRLSQSNLAGLLGRGARPGVGEARLRGLLAQPGEKYDVGMGSSRPLMMRTLANSLMLQGKLAEAEATAREALDLATRQPRGNPLEEASVRAMLARVLMARGQNAEAADLLESVVDVRRERHNADDPDLVSAREDLEEARRRLRTANPRR